MGERELLALAERAVDDAKRGDAHVLPYVVVDKKKEPLRGRGSSRNLIRGYLIAVTSSVRKGTHSSGARRLFWRGARMSARRLQRNSARSLASTTYPFATYAEHDGTLLITPCRGSCARRSARISDTRRASSRRMTEGWLKLNSNESPLPPSPTVAAAVADAAADLARYPSPVAEPLRSALARSARGRTGAGVRRQRRRPGARLLLSSLCVSGRYGGADRARLLVAPGAGGALLGSTTIRWRSSRTARSRRSSHARRRCCASSSTPTLRPGTGSNLQHSRQGSARGRRRRRDRRGLL